MEDVALHFFPLPHVYRGERRRGLLIDWPAICAKCDRQCESATAAARDIRVCSYGLNYVRVDEDLLIAGVAIRDAPNPTQAQRKRLAEVGRDSVTRADIAAILERCAVATEEQVADLQRRMDAVIHDWEQSAAYQRDVVDQLRPEVQRALAAVHDYKQFVQQIIQNMNVILETKYPGLELTAKLEQATHEEVAIYSTAVLMDERLDAAYFLESPERIHEPREQRVFRLHGLVLKYVRIFQRRADERGVTVNVHGSSKSDVRGNPRALAIIPQTLIDNALKYAPAGTSVTVRFAESAETVLLEVASFGPEIRPEEATRIFDLFFRGDAARRATSEGTGFGLASAQNVARESGTEIVAKQSKRRGPSDTLLTTFSVAFERAHS